MSETMVIGLRSVARHERKKGNIELAGIVDAAADEIVRLRTISRTYGTQSGYKHAEIDAMLNSNTKIEESEK